MTEPGLPIPPHRTPAGRAENLIPAAIALLAVICLIGISSLAVAAWPFAFGELQWRFQVAVLLLSSVPQLTLLLTVISGAGVYGGHHRSVRAASVAFLALAAVLIVIVPFFALDFLTRRHLQPQNSLPTFTREGLRLGATTALLVPFLIWAGIRGWVASRPDPSGEPGVGHGLVVGQAS